MNKTIPAPITVLTPDNKLVKGKDIKGDTNIQSIPNDEKSTTVPAIIKTISPINDSTDKRAVAAKQKSKKNRVANKNELAFTLTTGIESSGTTITSQGKLTSLYGVGLQYAIGKKLTVRTGINVSKKIYTAKDGDYKAPMGSWAFNVRFKNILADCKVLELPLSIAYKIKTYKKISFYASVGSSAYFMKREDYHFFYKGQNGNDTTRSAHFTNNSNHFFSSLNISAIAEQKITNRFSLMVEPFVKLPLGGIGFGKVKLYNTGVLLTAKFKMK